LTLPDGAVRIDERLKVPIYDHHCVRCDHHWEDAIDARLTSIPECPRCYSHYWFMPETESEKRSILWGYEMMAQVVTILADQFDELERSTDRVLAEQDRKLSALELLLTPENRATYRKTFEPPAKEVSIMDREVMP
jgi:predicted  nucleic acid-binding Zn-ribbon protein